MINKFLKLILASLLMGFVGLLLGIFLVGFSKWQTKREYTNLYKNNRAFLYDTLGGGVNVVFTVNNRRDCLLLKEFYDNKKNDSITPLNFDFSATMPFNHSVIVKDTFKIANAIFYEVIDFNVTCWGSQRGYTYSPLAHSKQLDDSIAAPFYAFTDSMISEDKTPEHVKKKYLNGIYGIGCP